MSNPMRYRAIFILIVTLYLSIYYRSSAEDVQKGNDCVVMPIEMLELPPSSGTLIYRPPDASLSRYYSIPIDRAPQIDLAATSIISPNGMYFLSVYSPNPEVNIREVIVFDQTGQVIYSGASGQGAYHAHWLGNDQIVSLVNTRTGRDPRLRSYFQTTVYMIDPFARTYTSFVPDYGSFFYAGDDPIMGFELTYDGRYLLYSSGAYDFIEHQVRELENYEPGIPSPSSYNFLVFDYTTRNYLPETKLDSPQPVQIYDLDTDSLRQVSSLDIDRPIYWGAMVNSWSPDETLWVYTLDFGNEVVSRPVMLHNLESGETSSTCLELGFQTRRSEVDNVLYTDGIFVDFAWSRDSRYLALQGVVEGQEMEESFGVYIYDTETGDIYEVYRGRADIVGWMANPSE